MPHGVAHQLYAIAASALATADDTARTELTLQELFLQVALRMRPHKAPRGLRWDCLAALPIRRSTIRKRTGRRAGGC